MESKTYSQTFAEDLPYSLEAEQSVLGAVLVDPPCFPVVLETLKPESFYRKENQRIFEIMIALFTTGQPIDHITVLDSVVAGEVFPEEGDARMYLAQLIQIVPSTRNIDSYIQIVQEKYFVRSLAEAASDIIASTRDKSNDPQIIMDSAEQRIFDIRRGRESSSLMRIDRIILDIYERLQKLSGEDREDYLGIPTGFNGLDRMLTGLNKTDLILIAARPGMGKTSFALNIATHVALKAKRNVAIFSLEMSREQLVERMLSSTALIEGNKMRTGELSGDDWFNLAKTSQLFSGAGIYVDDTAGITVPEMKARLRRLGEADLVIIDYLQLMEGTSRSENRVAVVSEITRSLKIMAKELDVPVVVLSQLSRGPESRTDHRPMLSDLRESGSIEQDADSVMFLYRDSYYNRESEEQNVAECIVSKNRHGETGTVKMAWDGQHTRFYGMEIHRDEQ